MFITADRIEADRVHWDIDIAAETLGDALSVTFEEVARERLPQSIADALRRLDGDPAGYWRGYY